MPRVRRRAALQTIALSWRRHLAPPLSCENFSMTPALTALGWRPSHAQQLESGEIGRLAPARVLSVHRSSLELATEDGAHTIPPFGQGEEAAAVGDWVLLGPDGTLDRLMERTGFIKRRAAGEDARIQPIAANIDTLFIVTSCNADFNIARLERYLALAAEAAAQPVILITKADQVDDAASFRNQATRLMPDLIAETMNAKDPADVDRLRVWCGPGQTVAFMGSSGVGKSTLVNALLGVQTAQTGAIREDDAKGRHTTTARAMHQLPDGGWLIDTPGMREVQLTDVAEGIGEVFSDLAELAQSCRFSDCAHDTEPGCAIQAAVASGAVDPDRVRRWHKLVAEDAHNTATLAQRRTRDRTRQKMYNNGKKRARHKRGLP